MTGSDEFTAFAAARTPELYRCAWLLCGDRHTAEDLVQETLAKLYVAWHRRRRPVENPPAYAHTTLVRTFISARRKRSSSERPTEQLPEAVHEDEDLALRATVSDALARLRPIDRAVLVLRFFNDLPVERVAQLLDLSPGAVRNRTMRALDTIRDLLGHDAEDQPQGVRR